MFDALPGEPRRGVLLDDVVDLLDAVDAFSAGELFPGRLAFLEEVFLPECSPLAHRSERSVGAP